MGHLGVSRLPRVRLWLLGFGQQCQREAEATAPLEPGWTVGEEAASSLCPFELVGPPAGRRPGDQGTARGGRRCSAEGVALSLHDASATEANLACR